METGLPSAPIVQVSRIVLVETGLPSAPIVQVSIVTVQASIVTVRAVIVTDRVSTVIAHGRAGLTVVRVRAGSIATRVRHTRALTVTVRRLTATAPKGIGPEGSIAIEHRSAMIGRSLIRIGRVVSGRALEIVPVRVASSVARVPAGLIVALARTVPRHATQVSIAVRAPRSRSVTARCAPREIVRCAATATVIGRSVAVPSTVIVRGRRDSDMINLRRAVRPSNRASRLASANGSRGRLHKRSALTAPGPTVLEDSVAIRDPSRMARSPLIGIVTRRFAR